VVNAFLVVELNTRIN